MKSPTTLAERALGAHTAKLVPIVPGDLAHVGAEPLVEQLVPPLGDQVQVQLAERGQVGVGVAERDASLRVVDLQLVVKREDRALHDALEHPRGVTTAQRHRLSSVEERAHPPRAGTEGADHDAAAVRVGAEQRVGIRIVAGYEALDLALDAHVVLASSRRESAATGIGTQSGR